VGFHQVVVGRKILRHEADTPSSYKQVAPQHAGAQSRQCDRAVAMVAKSRGPVVLF
jgi:hypothetical protein